MKPIRLHLGAGVEKMKGYLNVDLIKTSATDLLWDLNKFPYPFRQNTVHEIYIKSTLEHLNEPQDVLKEFWRICKPKAKIQIWVPHFESLGAFVDITHKHFFSYFSFDHFAEQRSKGFEKYDYYTKEKFRIVKRRIIYPKAFKLIEMFANKFPKLHEIYLRKFLPVRSLYFELEVLK